MLRIKCSDRFDIAHAGTPPWRIVSLAVISTSGDRPSRREKVSSGETRTATVGRIDPIYSRCQYPLPGGAGEHDYVSHVNVDEYLERWKDNQ